jgi:predicted DNA-binding WGR domain protein
MRVYMQIPAMEDKPPRFYQLMLQKDLVEGWNLIRNWGETGSRGRVKQVHFTDLEQAQTALLKIRDTQLERGYKVMFMQGQELPGE